MCIILPLIRATISVIQQSEIGRVVSVFRAHTTPRVSVIEILTTDLGLL